MNSSQAPDPIASFFGSVSLDSYLGATFAFAAIRTPQGLENLGFRMLLCRRPPLSDWDFDDDIGVLTVHRGWLPLSDLRRTLLSFTSTAILIGSDQVLLHVEDGKGYQWLPLPPVPGSKVIVGWRAHTLFGLGRNLFHVLDYETFTKVDGRLRSEGKRLFAGWQSLGAFLGEGGKPLEFDDGTNASFECFAPLYARFHPTTGIRNDGSIDVVVEWLSGGSASPSPKAFFEIDAISPPVPISLQSVPGTDILRSSTIFRPTPVKATLMIGSEIADSFDFKRHAEPSDFAPSGQPLRTRGGTPISPPSVREDQDVTLLDRWKRRFSDNWVLVVITLVVIAIGGVGQVLGAWKTVLDLLRRPGGESEQGSSGFDMESRAPDLRVAATLKAIRGYKTFEADTASSEEAARILQSAGLTRISRASGVKPVVAQIDDKWCVTIWPGSYDHPNVYGVRYAPCDPDPTWNAQGTYFEVVIPANEAPHRN